MSCNICCEKYNKSINACVTCEIGSCGFQACKTCVRTYLLGTTSDPHCMSCKNGWSTKFLIDNLNRTFVENDYKKHRKNLLVERQISKTPELMNLVERTRVLEEKNQELKNLMEKHKEIKKQLDLINKEIYDKRIEINRIGEGTDPSEARKKFIMPCPGDNCKGYLSSQYKCEVCKLFTCPDCFEIIGYTKNDEHVCKDENIKTAELIKKDTKGCPKCGVRISKISGCDQMWCTECKVAFSWNTGKIILSGPIHNPHYYNYLKENGLNGNGQAPRNPGDVVCGGIVGYYQFVTIQRLLTGFYSNSKKIGKKELDIINSDPTISKFYKETGYNNCLKIIGYLSDLHRNINHIVNNDTMRLRRNVRNLGNYDDLTVQYILNNKTKSELASAIFRNDNLRKKHTEMLNVYELLSTFGIERINNLYNYFTQNDIYNKLSKYSASVNDYILFINKIIHMFNEFTDIFIYCNKQLCEISYTYNLSVSLYDPTGNRSNPQQRTWTSSVKIGKTQYENIHKGNYGALGIFLKKHIGKNNHEASSSSDVN